jgi:putative ABC transport system substrate-binding protein
VPNAAVRPRDAKRLQHLQYRKFRESLAIAQALLDRRIPSICAFREVAEAGAMMSSGVDLIGLFHDSADYVGRVLKGEKPADLPVELPTRYQLVINLATARALKLDIPAKLHALADEVLE